MRRWLPLAVIALIWALPAQADRLLIEHVEAFASRSEELPRRGASMDRVREQFGDPEERREPVGEPPITRWEYEDFTVVFEHEHVIHVVSR